MAKWYRKMAHRENSSRLPVFRDCRRWHWAPRDFTAACTVLHTTDSRFGSGKTPSYPRRSFSLRSLTIESAMSRPPSLAHRSASWISSSESMRFLPFDRLFSMTPASKSSMSPVAKASQVLVQVAVIVRASTSKGKYDYIAATVPLFHAQQ